MNMSWVAHPHAHKSISSGGKKGKKKKPGYKGRKQKQQQKTETKVYNLIQFEIQNLLKELIQEKIIGFVPLQHRFRINSNI